MKNYYRLMLGQKSIFADQCFKGNFVGVDFGIVEDLTSSLPDAWREFNKKFIPVYLNGHPDKTKIAAGLACGNLWVVAKGIKIGDIVICPDGSGTYRVGEITSDYLYASNTDLPHRRSVTWYTQTIDRAVMSDELRHSTGSIGTVCNISGYQAEIEKLIGGAPVPVIISKELGPDRTR
ncbi:MAG: hypothetical protein NTW33_00715 [Methanoregula sp.]|nr:hypothetical protein [Methanoregula sp.]